MTKRIYKDPRKFDDTRELTPSIAPIYTGGKNFPVGSTLDKKLTTEDFRRRFWASGRLVYKDEYEPVKTAEPVTAVSQEGAVEDNSSDPVKGAGEVLLENVVDFRKGLLVDAIKERGGKATKGKKLENLEAQFTELGGDPAALYAEAESSDGKIETDGEDVTTDEGDGTFTAQGVQDTGDGDDADPSTEEAETDNGADEGDQGDEDPSSGDETEDDGEDDGAEDDEDETLP